MRVWLSVALLTLTLASAGRADVYEDYLEQQRRFPAGWTVYYVPEVYPMYGGYVPGYWFHERYADPVGGYYYSRYGRRFAPVSPVPVPAYPYFYAPPTWGGYYYPGR